MDDISELAGILKAYRHTQPRARQPEIGPSELGVDCSRRLAYRAVGAAKIDRDPDMLGYGEWRALVGSQIHKIISKALQWANGEYHYLGQDRWLVESPVEQPSSLIHGRFDAHVRREILDWKTVAGSRLGYLRRYGPNSEHVRQLRLYGYLARQAGLDVDTLKLVYIPIDRDIYQSLLIPVEVDDAAARRDIQRWESARQESLARGPAAVTPTPGEDCKFCPYRRPGPVTDSGCPGE